ncbi:MAG TPA: hypothetical protein VME23_15850 [Terracidiphilus sp.]|nr:hypothetical protein [Terracidiphilus sp.]
MAEKKTTSTTVELDGRKLVGALEKAGLDTKKLDLRETLGRGVDIEELQSRLRGGAAAASGWHVSVSVSVSRD